MTGEAHWFTLAVLLAGAAGTLLIATFSFLLGRRYVIHRRRFVCPVRDEAVETTMVRDEKTGEWTSVLSCSAFPDPEHVTCEQKCLKTVPEPGTG